MNDSRIEAALQKLDGRVDRVEQILPTLATRVDLKDGLSELRAEMREEGERTRRHFDAVAEEFLSQVKLVSEGTSFLSERVDRELDDVRTTVRALDRRVMRLEADKVRS